MPKAVRGRSQWVALLAGPVLALITFVAAYYVNPLNFGQHASAAAVPAFLLSVVVLLIGHNLAIVREVERASGFSDHIYHAVRNYLHVTKIGSPEVALQYIAGRLPILQEVRNTSFNLAGELERANEKFYETATYADISARIAEWTTRGLKWKDLGDGLAVDRLRTLNGAAVRSAGKGKSGYQYRLLSGVEPQINFILLTYPDGSTEVLFNWDFRRIGQDPTVLLSRDRDVIEMFAVQFEHMWRVSSPDHDNDATRSTSQK